MGKVKLGFFSFTEITDPSEHRAYNEWHQLDHLPEQLPLSGIVHGQRWVLSPACRRVRIHADPELDPVHYVTLYLVGEPVEQTLRDFVDHGARLSALGRFHRRRRARLAGPFLFVKAYASERLAIAPEALPYRPHRGVLVVVVDAPPAHDELATWLDRVHYPDMLSVKGVAGLWTFTSRGAAAGRPEDAAPPGRRISVYFLDEDPVAVTTELDARMAQWRRAGRVPELADVRLRFAAPLETITPWQWDWFDAGGSRAGT